MSEKLANLLLTDNIIDKLICENCKNYLSFFPILLTTNSKHICGRCSSSYGETPTVRVLVYEALAELFTFPCRYKPEGCSCEETPRNIPEHERTCQFRTVQCPFPYCLWQGSYPIVKKHCEDTHFDAFLEQNLEYSVSQHDDKDYFIFNDKKVVMVKAKYEPVQKAIHYALYYPEYELESPITHCQVILKCGKRSCSVELDITPFAQMELTVIGLSDIIRDQSDMAGMKGVITLGATGENNVELSTEKVNSDLLSVLKCKKCEHFIIPPIYEYDNGLFCLNCLPECVPKSNVCLNNLAYLVNYPCMYEKNGCRVCDKPLTLKLHQEICEYRFVECFQCSTWKGLPRDLAIHLKLEHIIDNIRDVSKGTGYRRGSFRSLRVVTRIINYNSHLFVLVYSLNDVCYFTVEAIESQDVENFQYEIEIVDADNKNRKILLRDTCKALLTSLTRFKNKKSCHTLNKMQLASFFTTNKLNINARIFMA